MEPGAAAIVVPVPEAEPAVSRLRTRFDESAAQGMPAHVTALYPFLPPARLSEEVVADLRRICGGIAAMSVQFRRTGRFPGVLYLDPEPAEPLIRLTHALAERWPETPPYGGAFDEVIPHLTVAHGAPDDVLDAVAADVAPSLPIRARLAGAALYVFGGGRWAQHSRLPFRQQP